MNRKVLDAIQQDAELQAEAERIRREGRRVAKIEELKRENAFLRGENTRVQTQLDIALSMQERELDIIERVKAEGKKPHESAFVLLNSDWHIGETVDKASVSGRNEYNPSIAKKRVNNLIDGALWMLESWRSGRNGYGWSIDTMVPWIGGDIITGMIHEDLVQTNSMSPTQEVLFAEELLCTMLEAFAKKAGVKRIVCPTSFGNHGRTTPDRRVSSAWSQSYEWMLYQQLAKRYQSHKSIQIITGKDEITRLNVHGHAMRFNHGDTFKFGGGVGGITIPARKWLAKLDATEKAEVTCVGHWHQYLDLGDLLVNNSLIGWGAYAQRVAPYAPPSQVCCLIDKKYGKRMSTEIFV